MPNSSSPSRCSSARSRRRPSVTGSSRSSRSRASLSRSASTTALGRLGDEALVGQLLLRARDLGLQPAAPLVDPARGRAEVDGVGREHRDRAAGHRDGGRRVAAVRRPRRSAPAARRARPCARSRRPPAARAARPRAPRRCGRASRAAPARRRSRARPPPRPPASISDSSAAGQRCAISRPSAPGTCDQISSVTNGITGWAIASVSASTPSAKRLTSRVVVGVEARLDDLQVPVAQLAVDEVVEPERRAVELERLDRARGLGLGALQAREDPRVLDCVPGAAARRPARRPSSARSSTSRDALNSLLASWRPCATFSSEKRTSCVEDIASRPKRVPSAPCLAITSSGSIPVPSDLDIRRPSGARIVEWL